VDGRVTNLSPASDFGVINQTVNGLGTNTGTGLPRQLQLMLRVKFKHPNGEGGAFTLSSAPPSLFFRSILFGGAF
ncbi:MAG TPA: hypothetical protein VE545_01630, partial [Candidatus Dormibacteraeota bacterium]|nr:hypothetical protein [Candidatus Dormibacteraeota bacterium]